MPITNPGMSQVQVMTDSMNLDSNDLVGSLEEFESLETIQAELERFDEAKIIISGDTHDISMVPQVLAKEVRAGGKEKGVEKMEEDIEIEITPDMCEVMLEESMHESMNEEISIIQNSIEVKDGLGMEPILSENGSRSNSQDLSDDTGGVFSDSVIGEEIIEQVVIGTEREADEPRIYDEVECMSQDEACEEGDPLHMEEVTTEADHVEVKTEPEQEVKVVKPQHLITVTGGRQLQVQRNLQPAAGVYVVTTSSTSSIVAAAGAQSLLQSSTTQTHPTSTILTHKDNNKVTRMIVSGGGGVEGGGAPQAIRILGPPGKLLGTPTKTITFAQAKQMGLFSQPNHILPATSAKGVGLGMNKVVVPAGVGVAGAKKTVTVMKSPTKILPAPTPGTAGVQPITVQTVGTGSKTQKVLIRQGNPLKGGTILTSPTAGQVIRIPTTQALGGGVHQNVQIQLPGGKQVQYVKLVGAGGTKSQTTALLPVSALSKSIPVALQTSILNSSQQTAFKVVPVASAHHQHSSTVGSGGGQRVLVPAVSQQTAVGGQGGTSQPAQSTSVNNIVMLSSHLLQPLKKVGVVGDSNSVATAIAGVSTLRSTANGRRAASTPCIKLKEVVSVGGGGGTVVVSTAAAAGSPIATVNNTQQQAATNNNTSLLNTLFKVQEAPSKADSWSGDEGINTLEANGIRPRKPCNCTKSMCLKLYCDCFANGEFCNQCNCTCCYNNLEHEEDRQRAIKSCLERNPTAFRPKIGKSFVGSEERRHNKGCNCRRSGCLKNYCECYEAKIPCSKNCKCVGCKNLEGYAGRRGESEERSYVSIKSKPAETLLSSRTLIDTAGHNTATSNRQAFNLLTTEVVQATCQCLVAQAEDCEKESGGGGGRHLEAVQKLIIEEFGRCLVQIIDCVSKSSAVHHGST